MNNFRFTSFLTSNIDFEESLLHNLLGKCKTKQFKKGDYMLRQGEICQHSFFIETGLARMFGIDPNGKEHILQFAPEGWFVTDRDSAYFQKPSQFHIQALEDTTAWLINPDLLQSLSEMNPAFTEFNNKLLHNHIRHMTNRIYQLLSATAEERYLAFIHTYPDILLRVPQTMVASYLGITPESLSRVRKGLAHKSNRSHFLT